MKKLYLVDVSSMFFRAFYAVRPLNTSKGVPTNAVYGFLSMIVKLLKDIKPDYLAFCFDRPEPSFRKEIYTEYKANRSEMPEEMIPQVPYIKKLTEVLGIPIFEKPGFEADDLIGTLTRYGQAQGMQVVIVSGDKDFSQLINDNVIMYDTMKDIRFTIEKVIEKWGVHPKHFIDYLAMTGDASDNIPGVRGVGPKGAQKLIEEFGSLENLYEHLEDVKNANLQKKLMDAREMAFLSKKLVTIDQDMDIPLSVEGLKLQKANREELSKVLDELEFSTFKKNLLGEEAPSVTTSDAAPTPEVTNEPAASQGIEKTVFEVQTLDFAQFKTWLANKKQLWVVDHQREYIFAHDQQICHYQGDEGQLRELLDSRGDIEWLGYDLKLCWRQLKLKKAHRAGWDSYLAAYIAHAGPVESFAAVAELYAKQSVPDLPDASLLYQIHLLLKEELTQNLQKTSMLGVLQTIELPTIDLLTAMETKGVLIDVDFLKQESLTLTEGIRKVEKEIHEEAGEVFNVASPKQLGHILFEKMGLPKGKKTKTGYSTNTDVLEKFEDTFPITKNVIEFRELSKLKSTYVDALPALVDSETGRVHTQYNQALTATGRLSSVHPNLQNIPIRTERGLRIRRAFIAEPGYVLVSADYSQIELRILAHISKDQGLKEAFLQDVDIHSKAASEIFSVPLDKVDDDLRRKAKAVNFGIAYGQGVYGLSEGLKIPRSEAKDIIDLYFQRFSGVKKYMTDVVEFVQAHGYVETILGRRRYLPEIRSKNNNMKAFAERAAINAPIQGMSSDLVKLAMIEVGQEFREQMVLQVHDELIFEIKDDSQLNDKMNKIKSLMENCMTLDVPLKVNVSKGKNWAEL
jgi:DNA polymerase-1